MLQGLTHYLRLPLDLWPPLARMRANATQRRHVFRWLYSFRPNYLLDTQTPWLTFDAIEFIKPRLWEGMRVFEYSSGGSTLFWIMYGACCTSVEHDPNWYSLICHRLAEGARVDYRLILPESVKESDWQNDSADPSGYASSDDRFTACSFRNYVTQIDAFPDDSFDLILVDGRARPSCVLHACRKVKRGGCLILDNSERRHYQRAKELLRDWEKHAFYGAGPCGLDFWETTIWCRVK